MDKKNKYGFITNTRQVFFTFVLKKMSSAHNRQKVRAQNNDGKRL